MRFSIIFLGAYFDVNYIFQGPGGRSSSQRRRGGGSVQCKEEAHYVQQLSSRFPVFPPSEDGFKFSQHLVNFYQFARECCSLKKKVLKDRRTKGTLYIECPFETVN